jgi:hypothetical protein
MTCSVGLYARRQKKDKFRFQVFNIRPQGPTLQLWFKTLNCYKKFYTVDFFKEGCAFLTQQEMDVNELGGNFRGNCRGMGRTRGH